MSIYELRTFLRITTSVGLVLTLVSSILAFRTAFKASLGRRRSRRRALVWGILVAAGAGLIGIVIIEIIRIGAAVYLHSMIVGS